MEWFYCAIVDHKINKTRDLPIMAREYPGGMAEHVPTDETRERVIDLTCAGFGQADVADYFHIDEKTLRKHYREELTKSKKDKTIALSKNLYMRALAGDAGAQEFWLKCQGRWSYAKAPEDVADKEKQNTLMEKLIDKL